MKEGKLIVLEEYLRAAEPRQRPAAYSSMQWLIKTISREVIRHRLSYEQLKRIFSEVRKASELTVPHKKHTLPNIPTDTQLKHFLDSVPSPEHKLIFRFLLSTGLRISEACNLEVSRIDFDQNTIFVKQGKGKKDRVTVLSDTMKCEIQQYLQNRKNRFLFENVRSEKFSPRRIQQLTMHYSKLSGVRLTPHLFRHLYCTKLATAGINEDHRMILCGHASTDVQRRYSHLSLSAIKSNVIEVLNKLNF